MSGKRPESRADIEIAEQLSGLGLPTTPRRVREIRDQGLIPKAKVTHGGFGTWGLAENVPGTLERARRVVEVCRNKRTSKDTIVLRLYCAGDPIDLDLLTPSLISMLDGARDVMDKIAAGVTSPDEIEAAFAPIVEALAPRIRVGRYLLRRSQELEGSSSSLITTLFTVLAISLLGGDVQQFALRERFGYELDDAIDELLKLTGAIGLATDTVPEVGAIVPGGIPELRSDFIGTLSVVSLDNLERLAREAMLKDLEWARDESLPYRTFMTNFASNVRRLGGPRNAFGMASAEFIAADDTMSAFFPLLFLALGELIGAAQVAYATSELKDSFSLQANLSAVLDFLPPSMYQYVGIAGERRLALASKSRQAEFVALLSEFDSLHPGVLSQERLDELRST